MTEKEQQRARLAAMAAGRLLHPTTKQNPMRATPAPEKAASDQAPGTEKDPASDPAFVARAVEFLLEHNRKSKEGMRKFRAKTKKPKKKGKKA